jgi:YHS domain-containing protein
MILRVLIYAALFYFVYRVVKTWLVPPAPRTIRGKGRSSAAIDDIMIQDPVCKVYFPQREGVHLHINGKDLYFCSEKCKEQYLMDS